MTIIQDAMFQVPHLPLAVTQVSKETIKAFSHSKRVGGYLLGRTLGVGSFAKVKEGLHMATGEKAAVKIIDKKRAKTDNYVRKNLRREGKLLQAVRHPNIVALLEIMETDNSYYLVTELCRGGDLMDYISARKRLQEKEVLKFIRQIVSAVDYLHKLGIIHRDLKIENLLLDNNNDIKLIDFGLSNFIKVSDSADGTKEAELCSTQCGSPAYAAPELLNHEQYGLQVDSWSIGVNMFAMLTGGLPFTVEPFNIKALYVKMRDRLMNPVPEGLTKECRDLLRKFLTPDPGKRVTIEQALVHPWLTQGNSQPIARVPCPNKLRTTELNTEILSHMSDNLGFRMGEVIKFVTCNTPSPACATYHLYLTRLKRHQALQESSCKKSVSSLKKNSIVGSQRFSVNSLNNHSDIRINSEVMASNEDCDSDHNNNNNNTNNNSSNNNGTNPKNNQREPPPLSPASTPPSPRHQAVREPAGCPPRASKGVATTPVNAQDDHDEEASSTPSPSPSPLSALSGASDRKENRNPQCKNDPPKTGNSQYQKGDYSPRPVYRAHKPVSKGSEPEANKTSVGSSVTMPPRPRLYKRRGETTPGAVTREKVSAGGGGTLEVMEVQKNSREAGDTNMAAHTYAPSRVVSTSQGARETPGHQFRRRGSGAGIPISTVDANSGGLSPVKGATTTNRRSGDAVASNRAIDSKSPATVMTRRLSETQRPNQTGHDGKGEDDGGPVPTAGGGNPREHPRRYTQNKNVAMLARRAAVLKTVEVKPATGQQQNSGRDAARERLQEIRNQGGAASNTVKSGYPPGQACRIIPRPFVPFRSAHERSNGFSNSLSHQNFRPPQKARTAESLSLRHGDSLLSTTPRASGPPLSSSEAPPSAPPRPVIVRKRLAKRHRLGEVPSLQPNLIQDIEHSVTTNAFVSPDSSGRLHTGKSPRVHDSSLPSLSENAAKS